jgi:hypothetical protein
MIEKLASTAIVVQLAGVGLNQQMLPVFLGLMLVAAIAWIFLSKKLYNVMRHDYPRVYDKLGRPELVMKKSFATNYRVVMFLFRREYVSTADIDVIRLCHGLRYIFIIYVICFLGCLLLILDKFNIAS